MLYKLPLVFSPQPEGGYTVTSPVLPGLVTEGETIQEALENARDAFAALIDAYHQLGRSLPASIQLPDASGPVWLDTVVSAP